MRKYYESLKRDECETPKSPPGDYNPRRKPAAPREFRGRRVKHLNPRQGITTIKRMRGMHSERDYLRVKHLNPRQGITTRARDSADASRGRRARVKHLNPRQGITTAADCPLRDR